ncbi:MAG: ESPR-type extended signal peptide-containing protein, partial [Sutterellaceae bacterium]|nr:ESPR-type extended signal peptide-containing protein [Sutterellaceae bacterium]
MNKTFKVVFSKVRGALMVANEATSSVQAKGTKTVVAVAAALVAGGAMAAPEITDPVVPDDTVVSTADWVNKVIDSDLVIEQGLKVNSATMTAGTVTLKAGVAVDYDRDLSQGDFALKGGNIVVEPAGNFMVRDFTMDGGSIAVTGDEAGDNGHGRTNTTFGAYGSFVMNDGTVALEKDGRIWIGTTSTWNPEGYKDMMLNGGEVTMNGGWITGNKRYITSA